jgi:hypothetical protein
MEICDIAARRLLFGVTVAGVAAVRHFRSKQSNPPDPIAIRG